MPSAVGSPSAAATLSPAGSLSPSGSTGGGPYPGQPTADPSTPGAYRVDSFVNVTAEVVPASEVPGGPPWRFDTGDPDPSTHPVLGFGKDLLLVVLHGPVVIDGVEWYLLTPAGLSIDVPTGWAPVTAPSGTPLVVPATRDCPSNPTPAALASLMLADGLPACYGARELTIAGDLTCGLPASEFTVGATWLTRGTRCAFDAPFTVYAAGDVASGRYAVTGHFDDPESQRCVPADGGTSPLDRLRSILECRRGFVARSVKLAP